MAYSISQSSQIKWVMPGREGLYKSQFCYLCVVIISCAPVPLQSPFSGSVSSPCDCRRNLHSCEDCCQPLGFSSQHGYLLSSQGQPLSHPRPEPPRSHLPLHILWLPLRSPSLPLSWEYLGESPASSRPAAPPLGHFLRADLLSSRAAFRSADHTLSLSSISGPSLACPNMLRSWPTSKRKLPVTLHFPLLSTSFYKRLRWLSSL
jgi:hypothetical protein